MKDLYQYTCAIMNFNKTNDLILELDKNQFENGLESKINELFDFVELKSELMDEYYNQVLEPFTRVLRVESSKTYLISLNLNPNPNEYCGYALVFYFNSDSIITLNKISHNESLEIKFQSDIWKKTN